MRCTVLVSLTILASASAFVQVTSRLNYHEKVGIPAASRVKAAEDQIFSQKSEQGRIAGGISPLINSHPYLAGLLIRFWNSGDESLCGASLLSTNRLLTAAHCWYDGTYRGVQLTAVVGTHYLFYGGLRVLTAMVTMHPHWNPHFGSLANNVAMITLPLNLTFSASIQPISLPTGGQLLESYILEWALAAGYGKTSDHQTSITTAATLNQVSLQVVSVSSCQSVYGPHLVNLFAICTSGAGGRGICPGDFGGPLVVNRNGRDVLIGISSFGSANGCQLGLPTVFTNVSSVLPFITQNL